LIEAEKAACAKETEEDVEVFDVLQGLPEPVEKHGARFIGEKCEVGIHGL
jgi:hypothetical protein